MPDLYERFPLYDAKGYQVAWGVRKVEQVGLTVCPMNRDPHAQYKDVTSHIEMMDEIRMAEL